MSRKFNPEAHVELSVRTDIDVARSKRRRETNKLRAISRTIHRRRHKHGRP